MEEKEKNQTLNEKSYRLFAEDYVKRSKYPDKIGDVEVKVYSIPSRGIL